MNVKKRKLRDRMTKFKTIFLLYASLLGLLVGIFSALFLILNSTLIHGLWYSLPKALDLPPFFPLIFGLIGGLLVAWTQTHFGPYPRTLHETLTEFKTTKHVAYEHRIWPNFISAIIVLAFGASLGPEAALSSILGGLITWIGDRLKMTKAHQTLFLDLSLGAMMATVFSAPFIGISRPIEEDLTKGKIEIKWKRTLLYTLATVCGIIGFFMTKRCFPSETVFAIRIGNIKWEAKAFIMLIPALVIGLLFGFFFLKSEKWIEALFSRLSSTLVKALIAGIAIGLCGMVSYQFLFSGEHELFPLSEHYVTASVAGLLILAIGKTLLTHICFAGGWRGGKIFPAILASAAIGFAFVKIFPYTEGMIVGVMVAASITVILQNPVVTATLLILLLPIQFAPFIIMACFVSMKVSRHFFKK